MAEIRKADLLHAVVKRRLDRLEEECQEQWTPRFRQDMRVLFKVAEYFLRKERHALDRAQGIVRKEDS